jgi:hypothetical protein
LASSICAPQVDELFVKTIGLADLSSAWSWPGRKRSAAVEALGDLITLRGSIAHRVQHSASVYKNTVVSAVELASRLAVKSTNKVRVHIHSATGKLPWQGVTYKGMS